MERWTAKKYCTVYNVVMPETEFIKPQSCEYYLHFNIKLPYPEKEYKNGRHFKLSNRGCNKKNR